MDKKRQVDVESNTHSDYNGINMFKNKTFERWGDGKGSFPSTGIQNIIDNSNKWF